MTFLCASSEGQLASPQFVESAAVRVVAARRTWDHVGLRGNNDSALTQELNNMQLSDLQRVNSRLGG